MEIVSEYKNWVDRVDSGGVAESCRSMYVSGVNCNLHIC